MLLAKKHYTCNYILHVALLLNVHVHVQYAVFIEFQHTPGFISYPVKNSITGYTVPDFIKFTYYDVSYTLIR